MKMIRISVFLKVKEGPLDKETLRHLYWNIGIRNSCCLNEIRLLKQSPHNRWLLPQL
ncbi:hypothetical protein D1872_222970 [compost metagenome]